MNCRHFASTTGCKFGSRCRNLHTKPPQRRRTPRSDITVARRKWVTIQETELEPAKNDFKVLCWNILADSLVDAVAYPPSCIPHLLWETRSKSIMDNLERQDADAILLQEVDQTNFENELTPHLNTIGYSGVYKKRSGLDKYDGCAIFLKSSCFEIGESVEIELQQEGNPLLDRSNIAICTVARHRLSNRMVLFCSTHLLFNPKRGDIKLAQVQHLGGRLNEIRSKYEDCDLVVAGDFNATPNSAVYHLMRHNRLSNGTFLDRRNASGQTRVIRNMITDPSGFRCYYGGGHGSSGNSTGKFQQVEIESRKPPQQFALPKELESMSTQLETLQSAYSIDETSKHTGEPAITTFHNHFQGTVDYMFYSHGLTRTGFLATPEPASFGQGIPSFEWPSDHISLVAKFIFK